MAGLRPQSVAGPGALPPGQAAAPPVATRIAAPSHPRKGQLSFPEAGRGGCVPGPQVYRSGWPTWGGGRAEHQEATHSEAAALNLSQKLRAVLTGPNPACPPRGGSTRSSGCIRESAGSSWGCSAVSQPPHFYQGCRGWGRGLRAAQGLRLPASGSCPERGAGLAPPRFGGHPPAFQGPARMLGALGPEALCLSFEKKEETWPRRERAVSQKQGSGGHSTFILTNTSL